MIYTPDLGDGHAVGAQGPVPEVVCGRCAVSCSAVEWDAELPSWQAAVNVVPWQERDN